MPDCYDIQVWYEEAAKVFNLTSFHGPWVDYCARICHLSSICGSARDPHNQERPPIQELLTILLCLRRGDFISKEKLHEVLGELFINQTIR